MTSNADEDLTENIKFLCEKIDGFEDIIRQPSEETYAKLFQILTQKCKDHDRAKQYIDMITAEVQKSNSMVDNMRRELVKAREHIKELTLSCDSSMSKNAQARVEFQRLMSDFKALQEVCERQRREQNQGPDLAPKSRPSEMQAHIRYLEGELHKYANIRKKTTEYISRVHAETDKWKNKCNENQKQLDAVCEENVRQVEFRARAEDCIYEISRSCFNLNFDKHYLLSAFQFLEYEFADFLERNGIVHFKTKLDIAQYQDGEPPSRKRKNPGDSALSANKEIDLLSAYYAMVKKRRLSLNPACEIDECSRFMRHEQIRQRGMTSYSENGSKKVMPPSPTSPPPL
ncbi:unnamed protein product [Bursaphelenchus okinawaensis]|uniref:Uncharacterized protein n=1 Tax=Bursaphelenchus okinawaensis TaxID=465554 RepID=A0A811L6T4_9BILA|nr:unnamed protein product [Bursaphelenchus okinawaensis]CAG9116892.1 unnamed protein product [Bursaphelenchus okinawaensis]